MSDNLITSIPSELRALSNLEVLYLDNNSDGEYDGGDSGVVPLTSSGVTINLLKISIVADNSGLTTSDYIVLYNPTGITVDATQYSLAVGTGGPTAITAGDIPTDLAQYDDTDILTTEYLYIDMAGWGGLSTVGNSIQLSFAGNVIDRVEYGAIALEPENTLLVNELTGPWTGGQEIYRQNGPGGDTNECEFDFGTQAATLPIAVLTTIVITPDPVSYEAGNVAPFAMEAQGYDQGSGLMSCAPGWIDTEGTGVYSAVTAGSPATDTVRHERR